MNEPANIARERLEHFLKTVSRHRMLIIVPTVLCTVLAFGYSILKSNSWSARQSLVVRDDLVGQSFKPGRFDSLDSLKSAQETILEIARKPQVIRNALKALGPPPMMITGRKSWPSESTIEDTQGQISISAPNGAEFGKTEVILLNVKSNSRERSRDFILYMLDEIDKSMLEVRNAKLSSMQGELSQSMDLARRSFEISAKELQEMDARFGADLATLRGLNLQQTSDGSLQQTIVEIRKETRLAADKVDLAIKQQELLGRALREPQQYLVTSSELLRMQPRLEQLVTGLSKSELLLASKRGKFTEKHTEVISAKNAIRDIKVQILREIQAAIHGLNSQIEVAKERVVKLKEAEKKFELRLSELSSSRVAYDKLSQEVQKKSEVLGKARQDLAQIQSVADSTATLLTRVGAPQVATRPDGPGKRAIIGSGLLGGLLIGFGLLMFVAPPFESDDRVARNQMEPETGSGGHGVFPRSEDRNANGSHEGPAHVPVPMTPGYGAQSSSPAASTSAVASQMESQPPAQPQVQFETNVASHPEAQQPVAQQPIVAPPGPQETQETQTPAPTEPQPSVAKSPVAQIKDAFASSVSNSVKIPDSIPVDAARDKVKSIMASIKESVSSQISTSDDQATTGAAATESESVRPSEETVAEENVPVSKPGRFSNTDSTNAEPPSPVASFDKIQTMDESVTSISLDSPTNPMPPADTAFSSQPVGSPSHDAPVEASGPSHDRDSGIGPDGMDEEAREDHVQRILSQLKLDELERANAEAKSADQANSEQEAFTSGANQTSANRVAEAGSTGDVAFTTTQTTEIPTTPSIVLPDLSATVQVDPAEMSSQRKDNARPIEMARDAEVILPAMPREIAATTPIEIVKPSADPLVEASSEEDTPDDIVKQIRAKQVAEARPQSSPEASPTSPLPEVSFAQPPQQPSEQSAETSAADSSNANNAEEAEVEDFSDSLEARARAAQRKRDELMNLMSRAELSVGEELPTEDKPNKPIPDQIKTLSDSIASFCSPLKKDETNDAQEGDTQKDF